VARLSPADISAGPPPEETAVCPLIPASMPLVSTPWSRHIRSP